MAKPTYSIAVNCIPKRSSIIVDNTESNGRRDGFTTIWLDGDSDSFPVGARVLLTYEQVDDLILSLQKSSRERSLK
jgi:hypothetical protein